MSLNKNILVLFIFVNSLFFSSIIFAAEELKESEIPLKIESTVKTEDTSSTTSKMVFSVIILGTMAGAAVYFLRKYSFLNKNTKSAMQIKILSQFHLGPKKSLAIVRVAGESILIGVTDQNINMIKSLSLIDDEVPTEVAEIPQTFGQAMKNINHDTTTAVKISNDTLNSNARVSVTGIDELASEMEDDFSFSGLKATVAEKLRSMRNIQ